MHVYIPLPSQKLYTILPPYLESKSIRTIIDKVHIVPAGTSSVAMSVICPNFWRSLYRRKGGMQLIIWFWSCMTPEIWSGYMHPFYRRQPNIVPCVGRHYAVILSPFLLLGVRVMHIITYLQYAWSFVMDLMKSQCLLGVSLFLSSIVCIRILLVHCISWNGDLKIRTEHKIRHINVIWM